MRSHTTERCSRQGRLRRPRWHFRRAMRRPPSVLPLQSQRAGWQDRPSETPLKPPWRTTFLGFLWAGNRPLANKLVWVWLATWLQPSSSVTHEERARHAFMHQTTKDLPPTFLRIHPKRAANCSIRRRNLLASPACTVGFISGDPRQSQEKLREGAYCRRRLQTNVQSASTY